MTDLFVLRKLLKALVAEAVDTVAEVLAAEAARAVATVDQMIREKSVHSEVATKKEAVAAVVTEVSLVEVISRHIRKRHGKIEVRGSMYESRYTI